ncbi:hypothetical protein ACPPVU_09565 [Mucilaginibacter sp. McL0603]|uniref:hypothetical protein n=1 Tax=Mucilaginibacter sp. McL0603 TaxID=3415670 RepID=UPI003CF8FF29
MKLHEVIVNVLQEAEGPLSVGNIADIIKAKNLWQRPKDGKSPEAEQVSARVNNYPHLFIREGGVVKLKNQQKNEKRLLRLTWNSKGWEAPCGHEWKKKNQGDSNIAFENQYGFGGEEWLFNTRYQKDGFQYGYIRGVHGLSENVEVIDNAYLFTIKPQTSQRYIVGIIHNLEVIVGYEPEEKIAQKLYDKYLDDMKSELIEAKADEKGLYYGFVASVKFKIEGNELFEKPIPIPGLKGRKYNRFQPYIIDDTLDEIIAGVLPKDAFFFNSGVAENKLEFERNLTSSTKTITRVHSDITTELEKFLKPVYTLKAGNLSVEKTRFGDNTADVVLKHSEKLYSIIEVKTSINVRKNIREALGQLVDYAFWYDDILIKDLIVVSPSALEGQMLNYFKRLKQRLNLNLQYWQFLPNTKKDQIPFLKIIS